ncbi:MAG TPA: hypothetical protein VGH81_03535 [Rudaea sp.]|jgi:hypothetical protein
MNARESGLGSSPGDGIDGLGPSGCVTVVGPRAAANSAMKRKQRRTRRKKLDARARAVFLAGFVVRSFYYLAIRRCKPGPVRWP